MSVQKAPPVTHGPRPLWEHKIHEDKSVRGGFTGTDHMWDQGPAIGGSLHGARFMASALLAAGSPGVSRDSAPGSAASIGGLSHIQDVPCSPLLRARKSTQGNGDRLSQMGQPTNGGAALSGAPSPRPTSVASTAPGFAYSSRISRRETEGGLGEGSYHGEGSASASMSKKSPVQVPVNSSHGFLKEVPSFPNIIALYSSCGPNQINGKSSIMSTIGQGAQGKPSSVSFARTSSQGVRQISLYGGDGAAAGSNLRRPALTSSVAQDAGGGANMSDTPRSPSNFRSGLEGSRGATGKLSRTTTEAAMSSFVTANTAHSSRLSNMTATTANHTSAAPSMAGGIQSNPGMMTSALGSIASPVKGRATLSESNVTSLGTAAPERPKWLLFRLFSKDTRKERASKIFPSDMAVKPEMEVKSERRRFMCF